MSSSLESATTRLAGATRLPVAEVLEPAVGCNCANACSAVIPANIRRWENNLFIKKSIQNWWEKFKLIQSRVLR